jgi:hypothetical protein
MKRACVALVLAFSPVVLAAQITTAAKSARVLPERAQAQLIDAFSIELNGAVTLPQSDNNIRIMLEEDGYFDGQQFHYLDNRQQQLHLIRSD